MRGEFGCMGKVAIVDADEARSLASGGAVTVDRRISESLDL
jgi:hypothetical protein